MADTDATAPDDDEPESRDFSQDSLHLVRCAQAGDNEAYNRLFERYYPRVLAIARARLGSGLKNSLAAEDVVQEALVQAIRAFDRFEIRDDASLIGWLARIVENRIRDEWRRARARDPEVTRILGELGDSSSGGLDPADSQTRPLSGLVRRENAELLQLCLAELEPVQRELILQRVLQGSPWDEVARALEFPSADAARMAYGRAKIELARILKRHGG